MAKPSLHGNDLAYWEYQRRYAREVMMPLFEAWGFPVSGKRILEIGCSEAGIAHAFAEAGAVVVGVEIGEQRAQRAREFQKLEFPVLTGDIADDELAGSIKERFDLIVLRDVFEHILDKPGALRNMDRLLADGGRIFFAFPPWFMPFGGHQQVLRRPYSRIPFLHYLPRPLYARLLQRVEPERPELVKDLLWTYDARVTLRAFHRLLAEQGFAIERKTLYLLNPAYKLKFGWPTAVLPALLRPLAGLLSTSCYAWVRRA